MDDGCLWWWIDIYRRTYTKVPGMGRTQMLMNVFLQKVIEKSSIFNIHRTNLIDCL